GSSSHFRDAQATARGCPVRNRSVRRGQSLDQNNRVASENSAAKCKGEEREVMGLQASSMPMLCACSEFTSSTDTVRCSPCDIIHNPYESYAQRLGASTGGTRPGLRHRPTAPAQVIITLIRKN